MIWVNDMKQVLIFHVKGLLSSLAYNKQEVILKMVLLVIGIFLASITAPNSKELQIQSDSFNDITPSTYSTYF